MCRTATEKYATRKIVSSKTTAITITNEDGRNGDPTINLEGDLKAIDNLAATSGFLKKVAANNWTLDTSVTTDIANLQTDKEPTITTLPVSKGGTGVNTLIGVGYFNGTSSVSAATSTQIRSLIGTSTTLMTGLNADLLDGLHSSSFSLDGHTHSAATTTSDGFMSTAHVSSLISAMTDITDLRTTKENKISLSGILKGNGTSGLSTATSTDITSLVPNATISTSGLMSNTDKLKLNSIYVSTDPSLPNSYGIAAGYTVSGLTNHYGIDIALNSSTDTVNIMSGSNIQYGIRSRSYENTLNGYVTGASGKCQSIGVAGYGKIFGGGSTAGVGGITYGGYFSGSADSSSTLYPYITAVYGIYASGRATNSVSIVDTIYGVYADVSSIDASKISNAYGVCISMDSALASNKFSIYSPDAVPMYHRGEVRIHTSSTSSVGTTISTAGVKMPNIPSSDQTLFDYYQEYSVANGFTATSGSTTSQSTVKFTRTGNTIIMDFPTITITTTATTFTMTYVTPTDMKPSSSKEFIVRGMDNGVVKICRMVLDTAGTFTLYNGINSEAFTNSGLKGILTCSISYTLG